MEDVGKVNQEFSRLELSYIGYVSWMNALVIDAIFYIGTIEVIDIFPVADSLDG